MNIKKPLTDLAETQRTQHSIVEAAATSDLAGWVDMAVAQDMERRWRQAQDEIDALKRKIRELQGGRDL